MEELEEGKEKYNVYNFVHVANMLRDVSNAQTALVSRRAVETVHFKFTLLKYRDPTRCRLLTELNIQALVVYFSFFRFTMIMHDQFRNVIWCILQIILVSGFFIPKL